MTSTSPIKSIRGYLTGAPAIVFACALALWAWPASAQAPPVRQSDQAVKTLLEQVDTARDKFEGNLDNTLKNSTIRNATGETNVSKFLQDLQDNTKKLKERFNGDYSASPEVKAVLVQGNAIDAFMQRSPGVTKGRSEWDFLAGQFKSLAGIYGTTFPLPDNAVVRRMNDKETAGAADELANAADQYKDGIDQDKTLAKADKDSAKKSAEALAKAAKTLKSRINDGKPATSEMKAVVDQTMALDVFVNAHPVPVAAAGWAGVKAALLKLEQSFGMK